MQRNHHASALLRACRQVPDWWTVGGRSNPYALEFVGLGSTTDFYSLAASYTPDSAVTMWIKPTATIPNGTSYAVFSVYSSVLGRDIWTLRLEGNTTNGNTLNLYLQGVSVGTAIGIGTGWSNVLINWAAGIPTLFRNGNQQFVGLHSPLIGDTFTIGHSETAGYGLANVFADDFIIDEVAFFGTPQTASQIYNSGVPLDYGNGFGSLIASYEVERSVGSISANSIGPRYYPSGTSPSSFLWGSTSTTGVVETTTAALRSSDTNAFKEMCTNYGDYVRGTAVGGATPLGTGVDLPDVACGLMPYPAGAGFSTIGYTGAFIGNHEEPQATPEASKATTAVVDSDSTAYAAVGGTTSLGGVVDARAGRLFLPLFVKQ